MTTTIATAARCQRCERVGYDRAVVQLPDGGRLLCRRCVSELTEALHDFMRGRPQ